ncbi:hypothetical protein CC2G_001552 [Coprinopsis cinerea AmutBmut pab1-1]|nr:hypothetical protein CC2G_001552 [Coprinopsis cinerea AmutBmut pab1-1]
MTETFADILARAANTSAKADIEQILPILRSLADQEESKLVALETELAIWMLQNIIPSPSSTTSTSSSTTLRSVVASRDAYRWRYDYSAYLSYSKDEFYNRAFRECHMNSSTRHLDDPVLEASMMRYHGHSGLMESSFRFRSGIARPSSTSSTGTLPSR